MTVWRPDDPFKRPGIEPVHLAVLAIAHDHAASAAVEVRVHLTHAPGADRFPIQVPRIERRDSRGRDITPGTKILNEVRKCVHWHEHSATLFAKKDSPAFHGRVDERHEAPRAFHAGGFLQYPDAGGIGVRDQQAAAVITREEVMPRFQAQGCAAVRTCHGHESAEYLKL